MAEAKLEDDNIDDILVIDAASKELNANVNAAVANFAKIVLYAAEGNLQDRMELINDLLGVALNIRLNASLHGEQLVFYVLRQDVTIKKEVVPETTSSSPAVPGATGESDWQKKLN